MLSHDLFNKMELLTKDDLYQICKKYGINTKVFTYNKNNDLIQTKNECCKYDLIKLLKKFFLEKNTTDHIVYHDYNIIFFTSFVHKNCNFLSSKFLFILYIVRYEKI